METILLGVDLGTSSVKVQCMTPSLETLCEKTENIGIKTRTIDQTIIAEQDFNEIWQALFSLLSQALTHPRLDGARDIAIGLSGQSPGVVLLGRGGQALTPYISWMDRRALREAREIAAWLGGEEEARKLTGLKPDALFTGAKLLWMARNWPQKVERAVLAGQLRDAVFYLLTGMRWTDHTHASETMLYDLRRGEWIQDILGKLGRAGRILPEVRESTDGAPLRKELARSLGVGGRRVWVYLGCVDSVCSHTVAESGRKDVIVDTTGSSTCLNFTVDSPQPDPWGAFEVYRHVVPGKYVAEASLPTGGLGLEWLVKTLGMSWEELDFRVEEPVDLLFLPFLEGTRSPDWSPGLRGLAYGLSLETGRREIVQAFMQGVALWMRTVVEKASGWRGSGFSLLRLVGGGSRLSSWNTIKSRVLGMRAEKLFWEDASAVGAVVAAGVGHGVGGWSDFQRVTDRVAWSIEPPEGDSAWEDWVRRRIPLFQKLWVVAREFS